MINMNSRDKKLLIFLGLIIIAFIIYYFILSPQLNKVAELRSQYEASKLEYNRISRIVENVDALREENKKQKSLLAEKYKTFFHEINEERILYKLDTLFTAAGLPISDYEQTIPAVSGITITKTDYMQLNYPLLDLARKSNTTLLDDSGEITNENQQNTENEKNDKEIPMDAVATMDIKLGFSGATYDSIMNYIRFMESMDRSLVIKRMEIAKETESSNLQGELLITMYSLPKVDEKEQNDMVFQPSVGKGKPNPF